jgi:hypothetical protein
MDAAVGLLRCAPNLKLESWRTGNPPLHGMGIEISGVEQCDCVMGCAVVLFFFLRGGREGKRVSGLVCERGVGVPHLISVGSE